MNLRNVLSAIIVIGLTMFVLQNLHSSAKTDEIAQQPLLYHVVSLLALTRLTSLQSFDVR